MTSYVRIGTWCEKENFSKCFSNPVEQLLRWSTLLKIKLRWQVKDYWKTAKLRLYDVIRQNPDMIWKKNFPKCFSDHTKELFPLSTLLKNQVIVAKTGIWFKNYWKQQNDSHWWRHTSKTRHGMRNCFFLKYLSDPGK